MTDPYASLGSQLAAAAERQEAHRSMHGGVRAWLSRRPNAAVVAAVLVMAGGAVAAAATGVLNGAPVKPEVPLSPVAGNGLPASGGPRRLALRAADPDGGLPWGMRIFRTTRGQVCVQVGRVDGSELGELGVDSAFGDDGRFHALSSDILPPGYGGSSSDIECVLPGQTLIYEDANADRSAERILPEEFKESPPVQDLRALSFGLLGSHAVSITYRTQTGMRTVPVSGPAGAFLIVEPAHYVVKPYTVGGSFLGEVSVGSVDVTLPATRRLVAMVSAVTFRFGPHLCSEGSGAPVHKRCPTRRVFAPERWFSTTRSLHASIHLTLLPQSHAACSTAFLTDPCYKGEVEFTAPYAVTTAAADYLIEGIARCKIGGRPETSWGLERDVKLHETVRTESLGLFKFTPGCASNEAFRVRYQNLRGPLARSPHESVIVGAVALSKAAHPNETPMTGQNTSPPSG